jgi:hypothetical protein
MSKNDSEMNSFECVTALQIKRRKISEGSDDEVASNSFQSKVEKKTLIYLESNLDNELGLFDYMLEVIKTKTVDDDLNMYSVGCFLYTKLHHYISNRLNSRSNDLTVTISSEETDSSETEGTSDEDNAEQFQMSALQTRAIRDQAKHRVYHTLQLLHEALDYTVNGPKSASNTHAGSLALLLKLRGTDFGVLSANKMEDALKQTSSVLKKSTINNKVYEKPLKIIKRLKKTRLQKINEPERESDNEELEIVNEEQV